MDLLSIVMRRSKVISKWSLKIFDAVSKFAKNFVPHQMLAAECAVKDHGSSHKNVDQMWHSDGHFCLH